MARYMYIYDLRANSVAVMAKNDLGSLCSTLKSEQLPCHSVCVLVQERLCSTLKSGHLPCHSVCDHSGTIAEYPQIMTASLSFSMCVFFQGQYPQIGTSSLSFNVCSFRNHCSVPSNQDSFIVIQCVCSFRSHFAVLSNQDSFAVIQCAFIQEPLCSTLKSGQLPCHLMCVLIQEPLCSTFKSGHLPVVQCVCSFRNRCAVP